MYGYMGGCHSLGLDGGQVSFQDVNNFLVSVWKYLLSCSLEM